MNRSDTRLSVATNQEMIEQIKGFSERDISAIMDYTSRLKPPSERLAAPGWRNPDFPKFVYPQPPIIEDGKKDQKLVDNR